MANLHSRWTGPPLVQMPFVIAVAGPSGAGKTTLVRGLAKRLSAATLFFDDFRTQFEAELDFDKWFDAGGDPEGLRKPELVERLSGMKVEGRLEYVVVEEPFGRSRSEISLLIDFAITIDMPLEEAFGRKLSRDLAVFFADSAPEEADAYAERLATWFERRGRHLYHHVQHLALQSSDLVIDGTNSPEGLLAQVSLELAKFRSNPGTAIQASISPGARSA